MTQTDIVIKKVLEAIEDAIGAIDGIQTLHKGQQNCIRYATNRLKQAISIVEEERLSTTPVKGSSDLNG